MTRFEKAIRYVLLNEDGKDYAHDRGGFTNDPRDPGGATMWGVIKTEYEEYLKRPLTIDEVKAMPRDTAIAIYKTKFWDYIHGDDFASDAAAIAVMDTAVNKGLGGCMTVLHDALDRPDIHYYREAVPLANAIEISKFLADFEQALLRYIDLRVQKYPKMQWARAGWNNRARRLIHLPAWKP